MGASGAVAGVLAGYVVQFPGARVLTLVPLGFFIRVMELPAIAVIGIWFLIQVVSSALTFGVADRGGVAFSAHVGGFVAGFLLMYLFRPRRAAKVLTPSAPDRCSSRPGRVLPRQGAGGIPRTRLDRSRLPQSTVRRGTPLSLNQGMPNE